MKANFAPEDIMYAALKTLFCAAYTTRNWGLDETVSRKQIYDLWEAIHNVPDLLARWRGPETEEEILQYFKEYTDKWQTPDLVERYKIHLNEQKQG
jgi:hypothetical protein